MSLLADLHLNPQKLAGMIDHTLLKPEATSAQVIQLCEEARQYGFASVCINPTHVPLSADLLNGTPVKVSTVIGFPLGATTPAVKTFETYEYIRQGAMELDMVINIGALKAGDGELVKRDIQDVVLAGREHKALVKVILETCLLTDAEKTTACLIAKEAGAAFVKTSTGFSTGGATVADVTLMRRTIGPEMGVKASGGIRTLEDALRMISAGANRIGASGGVKIIQAAIQEAQNRG
jgi:deoxyribose-phosphate aldolase